MRCETLHPNQNLLSPSDVAALAAMNIVVGISSIISNTVIAVSLWKLKMTKTLSYKFIFLLSISDGIMGITVCPAVVALLLLQKQPFCILEHFAQSLTFMVCQFSGIMVVIITLDRYLHMKYLTRYNMYMTKFKAYTLIFLNLNSCLGTGLILTLGSMYGFIFEFEVCLVSVYSLFVLIIFLLYIKTFAALRSRVNDVAFVRNNIASSSINNANNRDSSDKKNDKKTSPKLNETIMEKRHKAEMIFAKGMIFVLLGTALCYLPCFLSGTVWAYKKYVKKQDPPSWLHSTLFWTCILMYSNSTLNPVIMLAFNKKLQQYVCKLIRPNMLRSNGHDTETSLRH